MPVIRKQTKLLQFRGRTMFIQLKGLAYYYLHLKCLRFKVKVSWIRTRYRSFSRPVMTISIEKPVVPHKPQFLGLLLLAQEDYCFWNFVEFFADFLACWHLQPPSVFTKAMASLRVECVDPILYLTFGISFLVL